MKFDIAIICGNLFFGDQVPNWDIVDSVIS